MDPRKQLSIKTGSVRRLGGDYVSYGGEYGDYCRRLEAAVAAGDAHAARKAREFVDECAATRLDIRLRLDEACAALDAFMASNTQLAGSAEWEKAQQTLRDNRPQPDERSPPGAAQQPPPPQQASSSGGSGGGGTSAASSDLYPGGPVSRTVPPHVPFSRFSVAVYGGSQAKPGDAAYERAKELGHKLAAHDFHIVSGGYGGVMEGVSAGAAGVEGASVEGIISPGTFPFQGAEGNRYLTHRTYTTDLPHRIITFLQRCNAFVVLPGGLGTLTELCLTWNTSAITDLQPPHSRRALCLLVDRQPWEPLIAHCRQLLPISDQFMSHVTYVDSTDDIIARLDQARTQHRQMLTASTDGEAAESGKGRHNSAPRELGEDEKTYG